MANPVELPEFQLIPYETEANIDIAIDEAQVFLLERGNARGTTQERAAFARKLQADIRKIKSTLACMKLAGESPDAMRQAVTAQIVKLKASYGHFSTGTAQFIQAKKVVSERMDAFKEKVTSSPPLPSAKETYAELFAESKSPLEMLNDDDFWKKGFRASEREYVTDAMDFVSVATVIPKVVGAAIGKACTLHPKLEKGCKIAALVMQKGGEAVRDFLFTPEQLQTREKNIEIEARFKEERLGIPQEAVKQFYADLPGVVVGAVTGGGIVAGAAKIPSRILGRNSGYPVIGKFHFKPETLIERKKHFFAKGSPGAGFLDYQLVQGTQESALIYVDHIQRGTKRWAPLPTNSHPYSASKAGINALIEIGQDAGAKRIFVQFQPSNVKFYDFVAKQLPSCGWHKINLRGELSGPFPVFELTPGAIRQGQKTYSSSEIISLFEQHGFFASENGTATEMMKSLSPRVSIPTSQKLPVKTAQDLLKTLAEYMD